MEVENGLQLSSLNSAAPRRNDSDISINNMTTNSQQIVEDETENNLNELTDDEKTGTESLTNMQENGANETEQRENSCEQSLGHDSVRSKESVIDFQGKH